MTRKQQSENERPTEDPELGASNDLLRIPYGVQHQILSQMQLVLEKAVFRFVEQKHPDILQVRGWDCHEALELDKFFARNGMALIRSGQSEASQIDPHLMKCLGISISSIRHTAVHRLRLSAAKLGQMFHDSEQLLTLLGDDKAKEIIAKLHSETSVSLATLDAQEMEATIDLDAKTNEIRNQRLKLDAWERDVTRSAEEKREALRKLAGLEVARALSASSYDESNFKDAETNIDVNQSPAYAKGVRFRSAVSTSWAVLVICGLAIWSYFTAFPAERLVHVLREPSKGLFGSGHIEMVKEEPAEISMRAGANQAISKEI